MQQRTRSAWRAGFLYFKGEALSDVVQVVNRYTREQFVVSVPELAALEITGEFHTGDVQGFSSALGKMHQLESRQSGKQIELRRVSQ